MISLNWFFGTIYSNINNDMMLDAQLHVEASYLTTHVKTKNYYKESTSSQSDLEKGKITAAHPPTELHPPLHSPHLISGEILIKLPVLVGTGDHHLIQRSSETHESVCPQMIC